MKKSSSNTFSDTQSTSKTESENTDESDSESDSSNAAKYSSNYESGSLYESVYESGSDVELISEDEFESDSEPFQISNIIGINQPTFEQSSTPLLYYVKFKNMSYRHCEWVSKDFLLKSRSGTFVYNLFVKKPPPFTKVPFYDQIASSSPTNSPKYELYKPDDIKFEKGYVTPGRVINIRTVSGSEECLVKWVSLDISMSTWEKDGIPNDLIDEFKNRNSQTHPACYNHSVNRKVHQYERIEESPTFKNGNKLTDYQTAGLDWLQMCWLQGKSSILADEMGLGKTIESIAIIERLSKWYPKWGPFLVVCPLSTVTNWLDEFERWTNFRVVCFMGNKESRKIIKENMFFQHDLKNNKKNQNKIIFDVLVVSYEWLTKELNFIRKFNFMYTIIDEAQKIKNAETLIYGDCEAIRSQHFLLLTGTPIQNNLFEIWSLLHFIAKSKFPDYEEFESAYGDKESTETIEKLQEVLQPYILRRKKNDVNLNLPEKEETIIEVEMTQIQRTFSQLLFKDNADILTDHLSKKININNIMIQLRKLFCHPFLFDNLEDVCLSQYRDTHKIPYSQPLTEEETIKSLILASGKTILIDKLLPKLKEGHHKVLIFSQFTSMLDILEDYLTFRNYIYERLDGSSDTMSRSTSIDRFQRNDEVFVFLLSTRAGGLGINLTRADTVIIYDSDWNPQNDIQAQARCHRIGQSQKVNVYRLITRGSYESEMFLTASKKLALDYAILDSASNKSTEETESQNLKYNRSELEMILKKGAYYTFKDDPGEIDKFCSEDIDKILEHRSHTRKDVVSGGNSKFSKVTFDATNDDYVSKTDFWENLMGAQNIIENDSNSSSRIRTRIKKRVNYSDKPYKPEKSEKQKKAKTKIEKTVFIIQPPSISNFQLPIVSNLQNIASTQPSAISTPPPMNLNSSKLPVSLCQMQSQSSIQNINQTQQKNINSNQSSSNITNLSQKQTSSNTLKTNDTTSINQDNKNSNQSQETNNPHFLKFLEKMKLNQQSTPNNNAKLSNSMIAQAAQSLMSSLNNSDESTTKSDELSIDDFLSFNTSLDLNTYTIAISVLYKHGIGASRFFASKFISELCKSLIYIAFTRAPQNVKDGFKVYIDQFIPDAASQIFRTPYKELIDNKFLTNIFKDNEFNLIKATYNQDILYRVATYISNEKLPAKYQFVPQFLNDFEWSPVLDFIAITSAPFLDNLSDIVNDSKLPFKAMNTKSNSLLNFILKRIELNVREISSFIPNTFTIYKSRDDPKEMASVEMFKILNNHVVFPSQMNRYFQKRLLRVFYLYGIPENNGIEKIKEILKNQVSDELILIFTAKFLVKAIKYIPDLIELFRSIPGINSVSINDDKRVDISWIKEEAIQAIASNMHLLYRVRKWRTSILSKKIVLSTVLISIPEWTEINCTWWSSKCDVVLFNLISYYGFLFNSMFAHFISTKILTDNDILSWREREITLLEPISHPNAKYLEPIIPFERKKNRILHILDVIEKNISKNH
ncbi:choline dehydrogenase 6 [Tritrichomonas musculus]|uniref:Choline dehydrogenase 6 n=1 Tax=Tritrichomonas musculus TaxID=1915356 RepID=A0ABR2HGL2_9EUKA